MTTTSSKFMQSSEKSIVDFDKMNLETPSLEIYWWITKSSGYRSVWTINLFMQSVTYPTKP